ncbi:hypothetical protein L227DRAFT_358333 [Lentinus tigrinus ALCF2SS1-6]|uniref:Uncharacterized protein n=1 Tax=Lentinus tigrinus ALCF2SS1-6 TaxID=1328759 RepID=A0A5C2SIR1_9APHY|nr:hypothetical protein L227DRAFT_358333 [Lentinus tigrinus ALCF2SS1-6]
MSPTARPIPDDPPVSTVRRFVATPCCQDVRQLSREQTELLPPSSAYVTWLTPIFRLPGRFRAAGGQAFPWTDVQGNHLSSRPHRRPILRANKSSDLPHRQIVILKAAYLPLLPHNKAKHRQSTVLRLRTRRRLNNAHGDLRWNKRCMRRDHVLSQALVQPLESWPGCFSPVRRGVVPQSDCVRKLSMSSGGFRTSTWSLVSIRESMAAICFLTHPPPPALKR